MQGKKRRLSECGARSAPKMHSRVAPPAQPLHLERPRIVRMVTVHLPDHPAPRAPFRRHQLPPPTSQNHRHPSRPHHPPLPPVVPARLTSNPLPLHRISSPTTLVLRPAPTTPPLSRRPRRPASAARQIVQRHHRQRLTWSVHGTELPTPQKKRASPKKRKTGRGVVQWDPRALGPPGRMGGRGRRAGRRGSAGRHRRPRPRPQPLGLSWVRSDAGERNAGRATGSG